MVAILTALVLAAATAPRAAAASSSTLLITGAGEGHGVGMSQEGALGFAQHGWSYQAILAHYYTGTTLSQNADSQVRVLLEAGRRSVSLTGATAAEGHTLNPSLVYTVTPSSGGVTLTGPAMAISTASLNVSGKGTVTLRGTAENGVSNGAYRGILDFMRASTGAVNVINQLGLEDYVRGTIAGEMPASWPASALDAQAIASRTYAITAQASPSGHFDLYTDTRSQLYRGVTGETPSTDVAASATTGQVVTYQGHPAITFFFASSGGKTESVQDAFGSSPEPWLRGVPDPFDQGPEHHWTVTMSFQSAASRLRGLVRGAFQGIEVIKRGYSPRILSAYVLGSAGRTLTTGDELAARLGLDDTWAYFSVRTAQGVTPEPDLSSSAPEPPPSEPTPPGEPAGAQGGTAAG